jgi:hypothetical protein
MLHTSFLVISRSLNFLFRRFGKLCSIFIGRWNKKNNSLPSYSSCLHDLWRWNREFRNVGTENSDAGGSPKRKNTANNMFKVAPLSHATWRGKHRQVSKRRAYQLLLLQWTPCGLLFMHLSCNFGLKRVKRKCC